MKNLHLYISLLFLLTCAKEDNTSLIEGYQLQISQLTSKVTEYSNQVTELQSSVNSLTNQVNTIPGLEDTITSLNQQIVELEENIATLTNEVSVIPDLNDEISSLEETITSLNNQIEELLNRIPDYSLVVIANEGGTVSSAGGEYKNGTEVSITAESGEGFRFDKWSNGVKEINYQFTITSDTILTASFTALNFNSSTMEEIKYGYYTKDTLNGKRTVDLKEFYFPYLSWEFDADVEEKLDYLSSENFIVYWDKRYDHKEYAIDILRWSEFSAEKAIIAGNQKPKDFDTHRVNIFIFRNDEYGEDIFGPDFGQAAHGDSNGRSFITYPYYNNFNNINREYPAMDVLHETYHIFQGSDNYLFDSRRWYRESTAEYFQSIYVADVRPQTLRHTAHFLQSTHTRLWKGYGSSPEELQHLYGLQLLFHHLEWEGIVDVNFIGNSWNDSYQNETPLEYLIRKIPSFEDIFFDFSLRSTVIDFPNWTNLIYNSLNMLDNGNYWIPGRRHDLVLQNAGTNGFYELENFIEDWSFSSIKIINSEESNYTFNIDSNYDSIRIGLIKEVNNQFEYQEINNGYNFTLNNNQNAYIVLVNISDKYYGDTTYPLSLEIIKQ